MTMPKDLNDRLITNTGPSDAYIAKDRKKLSIEFFEHADANCPNVDFSENKFAFLTPRCRRYLSGFVPVGLDVPNPPEEPSYSPVLSWLHLGFFNYPVRLHRSGTRHILTKREIISAKTFPIRLMCIYTREQLISTRLSMVPSP